MPDVVSGAAAQPLPRRAPAMTDAQRRLRVLIAVMVAIGAVALVANLTTVRSLPPLGAAILVAAFCIVGDLALVNIRFGHNRYSFTWSELAVVFGLVMLPSAWFVVVMTFGLAVAEPILRRPLPKQLFNTAGMTIGATLARGVCLAFDVPDPGPVLGRPSTWLVLGLATAVYTLWNSISVGTAVAVSQRLPVLSVLRKGALLQIIVWFGNTVAGLGVATVARESAGSLIVLPFFLVLLYYAYFAYLRLAEDRDSWQVLQDTSEELARLARAEIAAVVLDRADRLFRAEFVELLLLDPGTAGRASVWTRDDDGEPVVRRGVELSEAGTYWPRAESERELFVLRRDEAPPVQRRELEELGLNVCLVLPLSGAAECLGTLRIGFRGPVRLRRREQQVLRTFGNQLAVSVQNARLFEQTREERAKLRRVVNNTSDGILSVDAAGRITSWNPAMSRMTGLVETSVLGELFTLGNDAHDDAGAPVGIDWLWAALGGLGTVQANVSVGSTTGAEKWLALSIAAVRHAGGDLDTIVVVARDVTALHQTNQAKEEFLSTVSHELRTPLTSLKGWILTLLRPEYRPTDEERRTIHESLLRQATRLHRLIEDLLSANALDEGEIYVDAIPVSVDDVVTKVLEEFGTDHRDRAITHERAGLAGLAVADPARLEQVLVHLLSNAAKFSMAGTPIRVAAARQDDEVVVVVADQGHGIPADQLESVFECFHRLGDYMTREQQGAGVGLHLARRLVEAMQGRIWVTSEMGRGSEFHVALPAAPLLAQGRTATG